jgi:hypothetical protein
MDTNYSFSGNNEAVAMKAAMFDVIARHQESLNNYAQGMSIDNPNAALLHERWSETYAALVKVIEEASKLGYSIADLNQKTESCRAIYEQILSQKAPVLNDNNVQNVVSTDVNKTVLDGSANEVVASQETSVEKESGPIEEPTEISDESVKKAEDAVAEEASVEEVVNEETVPAEKATEVEENKVEEIVAEEASAEETVSEETAPVESTIEDENKAVETIPEEASADEAVSEEIIPVENTTEGENKTEEVVAEEVGKAESEDSAIIPAIVISDESLNEENDKQEESSNVIDFPGSVINEEVVSTKESDKQEESSNIIEFPGSVIQNEQQVEETNPEEVVLVEESGKPIEPSNETEGLESPVLEEVTKVNIDNPVSSNEATIILFKKKDSDPPRGIFISQKQGEKLRNYGKNQTPNLISQPPVGEVEQSTGDVVEMSGVSSNNDLEKIMEDMKSAYEAGDKERAEELSNQLVKIRSERTAA